MALISENEEYGYLIGFGLVHGSRELLPPLSELYADPFRAGGFF